MIKIVTMIFASFLVASGPTDNPSDDTIRVQTFIPGFDDVDPVPVCSQVPTANRIGFEGCGGTFQLLPWNTLPSPPPTERIRLLSPAT